jgi:hypothetical protein
MQQMMDKVKIWAFPVLISVVGWFIINTLQDIKRDLELVKQDVKTLLAQSNIDKTRIDNLERQVYDGNTASNSSERIPIIPVRVNRDIMTVREEDIKKIVKA